MPPKKPDTPKDSNNNLEGNKKPCPRRRRPLTPRELDHICLLRRQGHTVNDIQRMHYPDRARSSIASVNIFRSTKKPGPVKGSHNCLKGVQKACPPRRMPFTLEEREPIRLLHQQGLRCEEIRARHYPNRRPSSIASVYANREVVNPSTLTRIISLYSPTIDHNYGQPAEVVNSPHTCGVNPPHMWSTTS